MTTDNNKKVDWRVLIAAIGALTIIEVTALLMGVNGVLMTMIVAAVSAIGGVSMGGLVRTSRGES